MPPNNGWTRRAKHMPFARYRHGWPGTVSHLQLRTVPGAKLWKNPSLSYLPKGASGYEKIGTVIAAPEPHTVKVAVDSAVYWPLYKKTLVEVRHHLCHDETNSVCLGDIVHIRSVERLAERQAYTVDHIVKPNIEGRLRENMGLSPIPDTERQLGVRRKKLKRTESKLEGVMQRILQRYRPEAEMLTRLQVWRQTGHNVRGAQRDARMRLDAEQRKKERMVLTIKARAARQAYEAAQATAVDAPLAS
eukprot:TRINITY_DN7848_c0_g1_i1.p1 TRINITY_DN7848_c0_g1~~TRINITY_DN7848_c0_g1_i1.p1  ORF type:complete len:247 (-),score=61.92 TRINITY_DN7848_c0_g1_i1:18-758(-)